jgi:light-regulated signal transduction histidine kinase (bacteriophytochrome)
MTGRYPDQGVDLTSCDVEPIHIIGSVQSFGHLLAFSSDWMLQRASMNCAVCWAWPNNRPSGAMPAIS